MYLELKSHFELIIYIHVQCLILQSSIKNQRLEFKSERCGVLRKFSGE